MIRPLLNNALRNWKSGHSKHEPLITIEVSKQALFQNLHSLKALAPLWQLAPALKSNAYGHGLVPIARLLEREGAVAFFCVDSYFEATLLRRAGIRAPLLVMGHTPISTIRKNKMKDVSFAIGSLAELKGLIERRAKCSVHLKFDTGMHRQGITPSELPLVIQHMRENPWFRVVGIMSHFADAETLDSSLTARQIREWNGIVEVIQKAFPGVRYYHIANSAGFGHAREILGNVGRPGLALYGVNPGNLTVPLAPALRMHTCIASIRSVPAGESVGYNGTFIARRLSHIATIPAGYFEGIDRRLSNRGAFLIADREAPIVGRVSMNICSSDVTDIQSASPGSPVVLISDRTEDANSVARMADACGTIPYEILIHIPSHLRRVIVESF